MHKILVIRLLFSNIRSTRFGLYQSIFRSILFISCMSYLVYAGICLYVAIATQQPDVSVLLYYFRRLSITSVYNKWCKPSIFQASWLVELPLCSPLKRPSLVRTVYLCIPYDLCNKRPLSVYTAFTLTNGGMRSAFVYNVPSPSEICGEQSGSTTGRFPSTTVFPSPYLYTNESHSFSSLILPLLLEEKAGRGKAWEPSNKALLFSTSDSIEQKRTFVLYLTFNCLIDLHFRQLRSFLFVPAIFKDLNSINPTSASCKDVVICINTDQIKPFLT